MLKLTIKPKEMFNEEDSSFVTTPAVVLKLEHSLLSVSKWESKWEIPFLSDEKQYPKTAEMMLDYIRFMTLNHVPPETYTSLSTEEIRQINEYIQSKQTATFITDDSPKRSTQVVTAELIYYWMVAAQIPFECEKWHLNRLLMLINIYRIENDTDKNGKKPKIGKRQQAVSRSELNRQRREAMNTKG